LHGRHSQEGAGYVKREATRKLSKNVYVKISPTAENVIQIQYRPGSSPSTSFHQISSPANKNQDVFRKVQIVFSAKAAPRDQGGALGNDGPRSFEDLVDCD
jgi:hypothetical protein